MTFRSRSLVWISLCLIASGAWAPTVSGQAPGNSTEKIRVRPSAIASRIGTAVTWRDDFEQARKESEATGKPIFWYVPTVPGSFMDRKPSIDRYMMAGPFSWPGMIEHLNRNYVCLKAIPDAALAGRFQLQPYEFVEPGFVVLDPQGNVKKRVDRLTTLHPDAFRKMLDDSAFEPTADWRQGPLWDAFRAGDYDFPVPVDALSQTDEASLSLRLLVGMAAFRRGHHAEAAQIWQQLAAAAPEHPLGWKAAAEAEGFGPFVRGFEVYGELPEQVLRTATGEFGSGVPAGSYDEAELWARGVKFLLGMQRSDGAWVDSDYDFGGTDSLPNVHVAVTSLAAMALLQASARVPAEQARIAEAVARATEFVTEPRNLNPLDRDELLWAHAYRVRLLARQISDRPELKAPLQTAVRDLEEIQTRQGSWYHEYANPFVTATALLALREAERAGATVDRVKVDQGVASLNRDRFSNGAFPYSSRRRPGGNDPASPQQIAASAGRMPLCELALVVWAEADESFQKRLQHAVETSFDLHGNLEQALKYDDHTNNLGYGGFFYWYDMRGRSEAIRGLQDRSVRESLQQRQRDLILARPEIDGCFVDSHELGRCYGTAMALLSLVR